MTGSFIGVFFTCGFKVRDKAPRKLTEVKQENDWGGERRVKGACVKKIHRGIIPLSYRGRLARGKKN